MKGREGREAGRQGGGRIGGRIALGGRGSSHSSGFSSCWAADFVILGRLLTPGISVPSLVRGRQCPR